MRMEPPADSPDPVVATDRQPAGSVTRGFLFADLRGYTSFVETHGAATAADLLTRFRFIVREQIDRFAGAEIRTEGDSFYVVFGSVSDAVRGGLAITEAAREAVSERPDEPIRVGIGIHAGETIETPEGFVGSPVNIAARICAIAQPGEVLVSDTVRALTQTLLPVRFIPRGRRQLKGLADPIALYAVQPTAATGVWGGGRRSTWRRRRWLVSAGAAAALALVALAFWISRPAVGLPPGPWTIGLDMPLSGAAAFRGGPMRDAVQLAIDEANAGGGIGGATLKLDARDDVGTADVQDPDRGAANVTAFVADPRVIAMVGPSSSNVANSQIPITNRAGLLQCSPANTRSGLTKPRFGALDLRAAYPNRINYVRLAPSDDIQGPAAASFAFNDLDARNALVVDDAGDAGREIADAFEQAFKKLGGRTVRRALNPGGDPLPVLQPLSAIFGPQTIVFFGGFSDTGAPELRRAMVAEGHSAVPLLSWDGIWDGPGADKGSYIQQLGAAAVGSYASHATIGPLRADFEDRFRNKYGVAPDEYAGAAYACAEVILQTLREAAKRSPTADGLREAVRSYAVDPEHTYQTALGTVGFDANGDSIQQFVNLYRVESSAAGGKGDWVIARQQNFGPAP
ncbi:MAG: ABC transporter substrate-binding protein [Chloroflexota bacterium]|nr:ABC transporter substrate-binding protein [Chloroflexota bacterium]